MSERSTSELRPASQSAECQIKMCILIKKWIKSLILKFQIQLLKFQIQLLKFQIQLLKFQIQLLKF